MGGGGDASPQKNIVGVTRLRTGENVLFFQEGGLPGRKFYSARKTLTADNLKGVRRILKNIPCRKRVRYTGRNRERETRHQGYSGGEAHMGLGPEG